ncbi:hypothetical protein [Desulfovibrio sp. JC022]|uniref:hypothetical protein n=1 Tax=Desulfovibrio sp. JC022 TaxID=2593642 RepID=UPI0013D515DF|nr:hypothetical protein [Desulfovibrio sp. JC022]NDV22889.1 hypothetical protein [Desulfovibrio sp. JC022]
MKILITIMTMIFLSAPFAAAQQIDNLRDLKRPRYEVAFPPKTTEIKKEQPSAAPEIKEEDNSRFAGTFKGKVTVHYKGKIVTAEATLHIAAGNPDRKSHYDSYILPQRSDYLESTWKLDKEDVRRTVTISGKTVYVTDIIEYSKGGNSQIRTLVFSPDYSALTFLKTEFDDSSVNPATGQIIGRFLRVK